MIYDNELLRAVAAGRLDEASIDETLTLMEAIDSSHLDSLWTQLYAMHPPATNNFIGALHRYQPLRWCIVSMRLNAVDRGMPLPEVDAAVDKIYEGLDALRKGLQGRD